ncbi:MAG TPA: UDP-N-acetylmuramoyl-L-alanyl-D-glutamate--2,6-diaminopimelate ligase [Gudongella oleilytica]|nr:UDP-N-acetylmuramoyl-L-alanyl-D-glutamate--2,6-diaminopimelate ligase [Gudongella oleilytica]
MKLQNLIKGCNQSLPDSFSQVEIEGICHDSRNCGKNYLFVAIEGSKNDGHEFIDAAIDKGAIAVIHQKSLKNNHNNLPFIKVEDTRRALSAISNTFYGNPSSKLRVIGVTGTNGKTSTTYFLKDILEKTGRKSGVIGTLGAKFMDLSIDLHNTTPESLELQFILRKMADMGAEYVVMEVSSHGIDMGRVDDIEFRGGIFTNLTQDHLDYHITMEDYYKVKKRFLDKPMTYKIINLEGGYGQRMYSEINKTSSKMIGFGRANGEVIISNIKHKNGLIEFKLSFDQKEFSFQTGLIGDFNIYNLTGAILAGIEEGVDILEIEKAVKSLRGVPGRMEKVPVDSNYSIVIDYAHTPDGLENVLKALKEGCEGRLITLFGCGGDRDKGKRPIMGKIAGQLSDYCIVTSDNPRWEDPDSIIDDIIPGIDSTDVEYIRITNRKNAIQNGIDMLMDNDIFLIAGKGHEIWQSIKGVDYPFDEKKIVLDYLGKEIPDH